MTSLSFEPLTPTAFLTRAAVVHGDRLAVVDGPVRRTYRELEDRSRRLAGALAPLAGGAPVAVLAPNSSLMLEAHHGVPWAGSPLVPLNTRLRAEELGWIVDHAEATVLLHDAELGDVARTVAVGRPSLTLVESGGGPDQYEALLEGASPLVQPLEDELSLLSIGYTSGTTGTPKGVAYHHRGAYLQALAMAVHLGLRPSSSHLWTLPMFHCHGWSLTWAVTAVGATHVCLRQVEAEEAWRQIEVHGVTHLCGAPTVLTMLVEAAGARPRPPDAPLHVATGGAPPTPALLAKLDALGITTTHLYGLTETFGPSVICDWHPEWDELGAPARSRLKARQGVANVVSVAVRVVDEQGVDVRADGEQMGELALRGNTVMTGYHRDPEATAAAAPHGWFRTGDLGVVHPDGYVEVRDRAKDVIISGGENISSVEVERVLADHPAVSEVAVVGWPDERWGETPVAFVTLAPGQQATGEELVAFGRDRLSHFKAPRRVVIGPLPKSPTGKVQKFLLRDGQAAEGARR